MFWFVIVGIVLLIAIFSGRGGEDTPPPKTSREAMRRGWANLSHAGREVANAIDEIDKKTAVFHAEAMEAGRQATSPLGQDLIEREALLRAAFEYALLKKEIEERNYGPPDGSLGGSLHAGLPDASDPARNICNMFESFRFYSIPYLCHFTRSERDYPEFCALAW